MSGIYEWNPVHTRILTETDQKAIALLRNLAANIQAGNVKALDISGRVLDISANPEGNTVAELTLTMDGNPDPFLR